MKSYPSIKQFREDRHANFVGHTFAKIDGSNLRFEWDRKKGWFRFGSRRRLLDETHAEFGIALEMFRSRFADEFAKLAVDSKWESAMVFCEFWGAKSFAGQHEEDDPKFLTPIDVAIYRKGLLSADEFVQHFESKFDIGYLGTQTWDKPFVQSVIDSTLPGMAFEGVIGKNGSGHKRLAVKLKSKAWKEKVLQNFGEIEGQKIIQS